MVLAFIAFVAAVVNGAVGYGFSSIAAPWALLYLPSRALNPVLVAVEVPLNLYMLLANRRAVPAVRRRIWPLIATLLPGVALGAATLVRISPTWLRAATYILLLPIVAGQAIGYRRRAPLRLRHAAAIGLPLGTVYSTTTISGPLIAVVIQDEFASASEFRAAIALVRTSESLITAIAYFATGLYTEATVPLCLSMIAGVALGVPVGGAFARSTNPLIFRQLSISFNGSIIFLGLLSVLRALACPAAPFSSTLAVILMVSVALLFWSMHATVVRSVTRAN